MKPDTHAPTMLSSKVCNPGLPVNGYRSKFLMRHAYHGWMLAWWMPLKDDRGHFGAVGIMETAARDPVVLIVNPEERNRILEWLPLPIVDTAPYPQGTRTEDAGDEPLAAPESEASTDPDIKISYN